jgi:hypothetical protein
MENGVEYEIRRFKGSFGLQSEFTGFGPDVDAAWDNITEGKLFLDRTLVSASIQHELNLI